MAKKVAEAKESEVSLGSVVMIFTKSNPNWMGLLTPQVVDIGGVKFVQGTQVTGKPGHRMEQKRTLIPLEHVASIIEFPTEEDLWSEPQPRHIRPPEDDKQYTPLTSHGQPPQQQQQRPQFGGGGGRPRHRGRHNHGRNNSGHGGGFRGGNDFNRGNRDQD